MKKAVRISWAVAVLSWVVFLVGCAGTAAWLSDAGQIIPLATSMIASILTLIAGLQGKSVSQNDLNIVTDFSQRVENGLKDVDDLVDEYKSNATDTVQGEILAAAKAVDDNIQKFLADTKIVDTALAAKVTAIATLVDSQIQAWIQVIPSLTAKAGEKVSFTVPYSSKEFKQAFDAVLNAPSGSPDVDAAVAKVKRL